MTRLSATRHGDAKVLPSIDVYIKDGYQSITNKLMQGVKISYNTGERGGGGGEEGGRALGLGRAGEGRRGEGPGNVAVLGDDRGGAGGGGTGGSLRMWGGGGEAGSGSLGMWLCLGLAGGGEWGRGMAGRRGGGVGIGLSILQWISWKVYLTVAHRTDTLCFPVMSLVMSLVSSINRFYNRGAWGCFQAEVSDGSQVYPLCDRTKRSCFFICHQSPQKGYFESKAESSV